MKKIISLVLLLLLVYGTNAQAAANNRFSKSPETHPSEKLIRLIVEPAFVQEGSEQHTLSDEEPNFEMERVIPEKRKTRRRRVLLLAAVVIIIVLVV